MFGMTMRRGQRSKGPNRGKPKDKDHSKVSWLRAVTTGHDQKQRPWPRALAKNNGQRPWTMAAVRSRGPRQWPRAMATGMAKRPCLGLWPTAIAQGHCPEAMAQSHGPGSWQRAMAEGRGRRPGPKGHGQGPRLSALARSHGQSPRAKETARERGQKRWPSANFKTPWRRAQG